ncbi:MAG: OmpA family protein [Bacteroidales bacterium]|nr:OmpA family protein [Bacteroidales bacterium]
MKRFLVCLLAVAFFVGLSDNALAQKKSAKGGKKKKTAAVVETPTVALPYNSNDCLFAVELKQDVVYGPTSAPSGAGRLMEVAASASNPYVVEREHNSVWYKFSVPYNGELEIEIQQTNPADDYDFMIFKYTDNYFSNNLIQGKILPVASSLTAVDTTLIVKKDAKGKAGKGAAAAKTGAAKPAAAATTGQAASAGNTATAKAAGAKKDAKQAPPAYTIGMKSTGVSYFLPKDSICRDIKSIKVSQGETYYILLDNLTPNGSGHTIKVSMHVDAFTPIVKVSDPNSKTPIDVDLVVLEKNTNNRAIVQNPNFKSGRIPFVPGFDYTLYAKRQGYFSVYKEFNANVFKVDTMLNITMHKAVKGSTFTLEDVYFTTDGKQLLPGSDTVLMNYVMLFLNHPEVTLLIKGYVATYGDVTLESDQEVSLERAVTVKNFLVSKGIEANRLSVSGMSPTEIRRAVAAANDPKVGLLKKRIEFIVTNVGK